jgi:putative membrane protein
MKGNNNLSIGEKLAIDRTKLANERTFLAFFRSFVVMLSSGLAIIKLQFLENIYILGIILMIIASCLLIYGIFHYVKVNKRIASYK